jgi:DNA primase catalytic core
MPIDKEDIEQAKRTDLVALVQAKGIALKKNGKSHMGLCPFHADKNPSLSITPAKNLFQCFGCGAAGDAIRFVEMFDQVDFKEAVKRLNGNGFKHTKAKPVKADPAKTLSVKERKLLARVVGHYQHALGGKDTKGLDYLKNKRGITDTQSLKDFGAGYANGTLLDILPEDPQVIKDLKTIGILNAKGHELFYNCVVFPLYNAKGSIVNLYGRNIEDDAGTTHLYLPGPRSGLVNRQAVKRSQTIILTESIIDALTLYDQGFKNTIPIYGVNGLVDDHLTLLHRKIKSAYLVFDADEPGKRAVDAVSLRLKEKGITPYPVSLPVKDVNIYFKRHTPEQFEALLKAANPQSCEQSAKVSKREQSLYKETDHGFIVGFGGRQYEIKGIQRSQTQLKVVAKASTDLTGNRPFELTTIDLYSSRSRIWFAKLCAELFEADQALVKEDIGRLLTLVEDFKPKQKQEAIAEPTREEKEAAMAFLKSKDIFAEILADLETLGVVGEKTNKIVCYLAAISRKLNKPLSVLIQSRSSAGKSTLQNAILKLVPDEDYESYTRVTDQALFYKKEDSLVHKILAIEEDAGVGGAAYSIRNIQSAGKITVAVTGKDPGTGTMETEDRTVNGPTAIMLTTTTSELDQETASRFIVLTIDESAKMTQAIHHKQRQARTLAGLIRVTCAAAVIKKHHTAQRLLRPIAVANNFEDYLSYPSGNLITRRDHDKYLGLIEAIAYLHQYQRKVQTVNVGGKPIEYVEVTLEDIDTANKLADEILGRSLNELAAPSATLLDAVFEMVKEMATKHKIPIEEVEFNRRQIREYINWTDWQIKTHIKQLEQLEYLYVRMGARGKRYSYALNYNGQGRGQREKRFYLNLTPVEEIKKLLKKDKEDKK